MRMFGYVYDNQTNLFFFVEDLEQRYSSEADLLNQQYEDKTGPFAENN